MQLHLITFLLLMLACLAQSCSLHRRKLDDSPNSPREFINSTLAVQPGHELLRRWYGVPKSIEDGVNQALKYPYYYPWPATCNTPNFQPVRYCWKDLRSQTNLQHVIDLGAAKWTSAMENSALKIILEPTCNDNPKCLCSDPGVAKDALMISDETRDEDDDWNNGPDCVTASTVGYRYIPKGQPDVPYRHYMKMCSYAPKYSWGNEDEAVRENGHEWGHVCGLQHEHQRSDRNGFVWFKCKNLKGYDAVYDAAYIDEDGWFPEDDDGEEMSMKEKMSRICNHEVYAAKFFPAALEYIRKDAEHMDNPDSQAIAGSLVKSNEFDYDSIMIYDGNLMSRDPDKWVLYRRDNGNPVWMGGGVKGDSATTQLSEGDVARIAMLYPKTAGEAIDPYWGPLRIKIRDRIDMIVPAPRKRDEL